MPNISSYDPYNIAYKYYTAWLYLDFLLFGMKIGPTGMVGP